MPDRESAITHLQIISTWASFARERDLQFFTAKHLEDIAQWSADALALLKEQEAVVHCKDCRYACACDNGMAICTHVDSNGSDTHSENWFCGDGKRRET